MAVFLIGTPQARQPPGVVNFRVILHTLFGSLSSRAACRQRTLQIGSCENISQIPTPSLFKNTWPKPLLCSFSIRFWGRITANPLCPQTQAPDGRPHQSTRGGIQTHTTVLAGRRTTTYATPAYKCAGWDFHPSCRSHQSPTPAPSEALALFPCLLRLLHWLRLLSTAHHDPMTRKP